MPFMQNPLPFVLLGCVYLFIVGVGKKWMKHGEPLKIDLIIIVYNFIQIIINSMLVLMVSSFVDSIPNAKCVQTK